MFDHVKFGVSDFAASKAFFVQALQPLGVDETTYAALARLSIVDRAAVIASLAERLDRRDVDAIVGGNPNKRADRARSRYLAAQGVAVGAASRTASTSVRDASEHIGFLEWLVAGAVEDPEPDLALHATRCADCTRAVASFDALAEIELGVVALPASQSVAVAAVPLSTDERWGVPPWLTGRGGGLLVAGIGLALLVRVLIGGQGALFQGILGGNGGPRQGVIQGDLRNGTAPSATPRPAVYGPGAVLGGLIANSQPPAGSGAAPAPGSGPTPGAGNAGIPPVTPSPTPSFAASPPGSPLPGTTPVPPTPPTPPAPLPTSLPSLSLPPVPTPTVGLPIPTLPPTPIPSVILPIPSVAVSPLPSVGVLPSP